MIANKIKRRHVDYTWPGFVDALSSLLMVIIFVLMIFVLSQFFLSQKMSGQDEALIKLKTNLIELSELLSLERQSTTQLTSHLSILENKIVKLKNKLELENKLNIKNQDELVKNKVLIDFNDKKIKELEQTLDLKIKAILLSKNNMKKKNFEIVEKNDFLKASKEEINRLVSASLKLRNKLSQLQALLSVYKAKDKKDKVKTLNIGKDLNSALARKVEELQKFKSEFFGRVKELIKDRPEIRIVGDRFVFQSEVLFSLRFC